MKQLVLYIIFILILSCNSFSLFAKEIQIIDSLKKQVKAYKNDTLLPYWIDALASAYSEINPDSALNYANKSYRLAKKSNKLEFQINALITLSVIYRERGQYDKALGYLKSALIIAKKNKLNSECFQRIYSSFNLAYTEQGNYTVGIEYGFKSLHEIEKTGDTLTMALANNNLANTFFQIANYDKAMFHYKKALFYVRKVNHLYGQCLLTGNIGSVYYSIEKYDSSKIYFEKSLAFSKQINDVVGEATAYLNIGSYYQIINKDKIAIDYFNKALKIFEEMQMLPNQSDLYNNLSNSYFNLKEYSKAEKFAKISLGIANKIESYPHKQLAHLTLKNVYDKMKKTELAYFHYVEYITARDTIFNEKNRKEQFKSEIVYEYNKKAATDSVSHSKALEIKNLVIGQQRAESRKQKILILFIVTGLILLLIIAFVIFRSLRITRRQKIFIENQKILVDEKNIKLNQQNEEIITQRDEIEAQRDEIEAQRDFVTTQKEHIEEIHKEVTDSINYAKRIQEAVLPVSEQARLALGEHFVLFKPKDIVSGDFYFSTKVSNLLIVAVADCTGHGVPGAFMSMLGISFLNEIVLKQEIHNASHVLNHLRIEIINALQQKGVHGEQKDGMDISLLVVNTDTNECQWAGANNPLYIIPSVTLNEREEQLSCEAKSNSRSIDSSALPQNDNRDLFELKGDKMPIAIYPIMKEFTNHVFSLQKGDSVYLFTDGYADQFGGPKGRKFMYKKFKEILLEHSNKPSFEQKELLDTAFEQWKGQYAQIDDVTVLGIRI